MKNGEKQLNFILFISFDVKIQIRKENILEELNKMKLQFGLRFHKLEKRSNNWIRLKRRLLKAWNTFFNKNFKTRE